MTTGEDAPLSHKIRISDGAIRRSAHDGDAATGVEIGGILVGWWEGERVAVVHSLVPVPDRQAGPFHYQRRAKLAQAALDRATADVGDAWVGYIGEWHTHPAPHPPSLIDRAAIAATATAGRGRVALIVLAFRPNGDFDVHGAVAEHRWPRRPRVVPAAIERTSP